MKWKILPDFYGPLTENMYFMQTFFFLGCNFQISFITMPFLRKTHKSTLKSVWKALYFIFRHHRSRQQQPQGGASGSTAGSTGSVPGSTQGASGTTGASTEEPGLPPGPPPPPVTRRRRRRSITKENASPARKISTAHDADGEDNDGNYSCNKITTTWIQISRQNWNYFFSNISQQMMS